MSVLVTRPAPDNESTADALRARGYAALLAPMLSFEPLQFDLDEKSLVSGVILTSVNAVRAIARHPALSRIRNLAVFAVGERTASAASAAGFGNIHIAGGDAVALQSLVTATVPPGASPLLYLSAEEISRDLGAALGASGITVERIPVYRMRDCEALPADVQAAFKQRVIEAVLHYSRRSAMAFSNAADRAGIAGIAHSIPQLCLSEAVAESLRDAGAKRVSVAPSPSEASLLDALEHVLRGAV